MSDVDDTRWHKDCVKICSDCSPCLNWDTDIQETTQVITKKFVTVGSVRYGIRLGAVSPPPPGAGPRYRSQCCWHFAPSPASSINNHDIFRCVNRVRMTEDTTSELSEQAIVCDRDQVLCSTRTKTLLKNQLRRRAFVRPQAYTRLCECGYIEAAGADPTNLDRLPIFRFGGNRSTNTGKVRDRDKKDEQRLRELTDRFKRVPVPPPRTRHVVHKTPQETVTTTTTAAPVTLAPTPTATLSTVAPAPSTSPSISCTLPIRSASFSQVDYSADDKKYVRRRPQNAHSPDCVAHAEYTLPRPKHRQTTTVDIRTHPDPESADPSQNQNPDNDEDDFTTIEKQKKRDKSRRRKGMYISQWPNEYQTGENAIDQFQDGEFSLCSERPQSDGSEIPKLQINSSDSILDDNSLEPTSPDDNQILEWPACDDKDFLQISPRKTLLRVDSFSESEPDQGDRRSDKFNISDVSDSEGKLQTDLANPIVPRRYYKRPLRGPYGQMLEAEMKRPDIRKNSQYNDLKFLEDISSKSDANLSPRSKMNQSHMDDGQRNKFQVNILSSKHANSTTKRKVSVDGVAVPSSLLSDNEQKLVINHQRTTSSPSKLEGLVSGEHSGDLEQLLRGSSEQLLPDIGLQKYNDTRTHVVVELYDTERTYVESLQILVSKYFEPLKNPENAGLLDTPLVEEIFFQVPNLLDHHHVFLEELRKRLEHWDIKQKLGDVFLDMFSKSEVVETYTNYINNSKRAREIIKSAQQSKPAFARFLEAMAREHKGKLALDSLLIKPIQKFPKYELLLQRLLKHTDPSHPDHTLLLSAERVVHEQLLKINCTERETLELEQLREIEGLIEGLLELVSADRQYLRHDLVNMAAGGGARKERALFLFSDLLLVTSIKRRSGTIKRPITVGQGTVTSTLEANKYKLLMKIPLQDLEIVKAKDENLRQMMIEIENMTEDIAVLNQMNDMAWSLHCPHKQLDDIVKEMIANLNKQLTEQQNSDSQLSCLDLTLNTTNCIQNISIMFLKPEKRASWEESFNDAKHKLALCCDKRACPELVTAVPIRKTRAGLQFTCAAPTTSNNGKDVWVCNSDGYVGQVCILSLEPEPTVTSCNGVCNAKILCIASVPGISNSVISDKGPNNSDAKEEQNTIQFDSSSSSEDDKSDCDEQEDNRSSTATNVEPINVEIEEGDTQQSTMWLGTEDGCIHIYNSSDNIRIKKNKFKLQHGYAILSIIYLDNRVFVSLANGDIIIYERDHVGGWNTSVPITVTITSPQQPVSKMIPNAGQLWCGCGNTIKVVDIQSLTVENTFTINNDLNKSITCIVIYGNGVWLSLQNSSVVKCYHALSFDFLCEINLAPAVTKMLTSCDDIIRQHKAACLRVTSLLACKDLLWIGTSAGVILTVPLPHIGPSTSKFPHAPSIVGVPHGHTGHVRFLTNIEWHISSLEVQRLQYKGKPEQRNSAKHLIISGGDGYEDFRNTNLSEIAGREDSTNHLLLWNI